MTDKCHVEFRDGNPMCSIHKHTMLVEFTVTEIDIGSGPSPHPFKPTSYYCPASGQTFPDILGVPPTE
jgi:hypothetical protein